MKSPYLVTAKTKAHKEAANLLNILQTTDMNSVYNKNKFLLSEDKTYKPVNMLHITLKVDELKPVPNVFTTVPSHFLYL